MDTSMLMAFEETKNKGNKDLNIKIEEGTEETLPLDEDHEKINNEKSHPEMNTLNLDKLKYMDNNYVNTTNEGMEELDELDNLEYIGNDNDLGMISQDEEEEALRESQGYVVHSKLLKDSFTGLPYCVGDGKVYYYKAPRIIEYDLKTKEMKEYPFQSDPSDFGAPEAPETKRGHTLTYVPKKKIIILTGGTPSDGIAAKKNKKNPFARFFVRKKSKMVMLKSTYAFLLKRGTWLKLADLPKPMVFHAAVMHEIQGNKVLTTNGNGSTFTYIFSKDAWVRLPNRSGIYPSSRTHHSLGVYDDNSLILYGGRELETKSYVFSVYLYDELTQSWELLKSTGKGPQKPGTAAMVGSNQLLVYTNDEHAYILTISTGRWIQVRPEGCMPEVGFQRYNLVSDPEKDQVLAASLTGGLYLFVGFERSIELETLSMSLREDVTFKDVKIHLVNAEDDVIAEFLAHGFILIQSKTFASQLKKKDLGVSPMHQPVEHITIKDIKKDIFTDILAYLYGTPLPPFESLDDAKDFLLGAKQLDIVPLLQACVQYMIKCMDETNVVDLILFAAYHDIESLQHACVRVMNTCFIHVLEDERLANLPSKVLYWLMKMQSGLAALPSRPTELNAVTHASYVLYRHLLFLTRTGDMFDFIFRSGDGRSIKVHAGIVCIRCPSVRQLVANAPANRIVFNGENDHLYLSGKQLKLIVDDFYGILDLENSPIIAKLKLDEMIAIVEASASLGFQSMVDAMMTRMAMHVDEHNAIQLLDFAIRMNSSTDNPLRHQCMLRIRKPETDLEYSMMMSQFFEAKHAGRDGTEVLLHSPRPAGPSLYLASLNQRTPKTPRHQGLVKQVLHEDDVDDNSNPSDSPRVPSSKLPLTTPRAQDAQTNFVQSTHVIPLSSSPPAEKPSSTTTTPQKTTLPEFQTPPPPLQVNTDRLTEPIPVQNDDVETYGEVDDEEEEEDDDDEMAAAITIDAPSSIL